MGWRDAQRRHCPQACDGNSIPNRPVAQQITIVADSGHPVSAAGAETRYLMERKLDFCRMRVRIPAARGWF
ncbi:hypothetical protein A5675_05695 [Mycobacterium malmoense]|nr:hypothetical protein A5675_05695 [Mycobacterium malmoense]